MSAPLTSAPVSPQEPISPDPRYTTKYVTVLGHRMAYVEAGSGDHTVLFVHGNPTSKYMWRNVMSRCETLGRVVAPDLIGMGESAKVEGGEHDRYDLKEQCRYFAAFMEEVGVEGDVTLVGHSWGGTIAAHWGSFNPGRVRGLVCLEVVYVPFSCWEDVPKKIRGGVKLLKRRPFKFGCCEFDLGEFLIMKKNLMVESMVDRVERSDFVKEGPEMTHYRTGFEDVESRAPVLSFVRSIPVAGEPKEVVDIMGAGRRWIVEEGMEMPKLFFSVEPGTMMDADRDFIRSWTNVTEVGVSGGHMATEDSPREIGDAIAKWFREKVLTVLD